MPMSGMPARHTDLAVLSRVSPAAISFDDLGKTGSEIHHRRLARQRS
jgi:hypothetical protein